MELKAIIGARREDARKSRLIECICDSDANRGENPELFLETTSFTKIKDVEKYIHVINSSKGNLYIDMRNLQDPQKFYQSLLNKGFTILDSEIIQDYKVKQPEKQLNLLLR